MKTWPIVWTLFCAAWTLAIQPGSAWGQWSVPQDLDKTSSTLYRGRVKGIGYVHTRVDEPGEPVSEPIRVSVLVECTVGEKQILVIPSRPACAWIETAVDPAARKVKAKVKLFNPKTDRCETVQEWQQSIPENCP